MYQCLGLGTVDEGGCGEDWWHPECLLGIRRDWQKTLTSNGKTSNSQEGQSETAQLKKPQQGAAPGDSTTQNEQDIEHTTNDLAPPPPGFPDEDDFEHLLCYKCVGAFPWIKRYAGASGFLPGLLHQEQNGPATSRTTVSDATTAPTSRDQAPSDVAPRKRKSPAIDGNEFANGADTVESTAKRIKTEPSNEDVPTTTHKSCKYDQLPEAPSGRISLFLPEDFRDHICHCPTCFSRLKEHPQLLSEEDTYSPPLSEDDSDAANADGTGSVGSRSLLDRGEAALSNMDRVKAIEGAMAYNHLRDKVKDFLKPFAESGQAVGAEDVKQYFEKLRGDEAAMREAALKGGAGEDDGSGDNRREQSGY